MRKIDKPTYNTKKIVNECSESFRDKTKRENYQKSAIFIATESDSYDKLAIKQSLYKIKPHNKVNSILTASDMEKLYSDKFAKHASVRPKYYDKIMVSSAGRCPICGVGVVSNLDHYLAKSIYPTYAVTPTNLIPICRDCNYNKSDTKIDSITSAPFHPYYDSIDNIEWLVAKLQVANGQIVAQYSVNEEIELYNADLYNRLCNHFDVYKLNKVYGVQSSAEIADNYRQWKDNYNTWGKKYFLRFLEQQLNSCEIYQKNTWKTALLRAFLNNITLLKRI